MTGCGAHHPDHPWLVCTVDRGHGGPHQSFYLDRLHEWPQTQKSKG